MTDGFHDFYEHWRESSTRSKFLDEFPYKLSLGVDEDGKPLLPYRSNETSGGQILVTQSYEDLFNRILHLRETNMGSAGGIVLTGQPGSGEVSPPDPAPCYSDGLRARLSSRKNYIPEIHARATDFSSPGRTPV